MGERRLHSEPVRVTVGKVTAETRYSGALVWVGGEGKSGSTGWSHSFPIASLESNRDMHKRMSKNASATEASRKRDKAIAKALSALIDALANAKQAAKEKAHG